MKCLNCGIIVEDINQTKCPKCDVKLRGEYVNEIHVINIAHEGEDWLDAKDKIDIGIDYCLKYNLKGLKIIHGYGSTSGHTSIIKKNAVPYLKKYASHNNAILKKDKKNKGVHFLYFN